MYLKHDQKKSGYILILSLLITSALTLLITSVYHKVSVYKPYMRALMQREKAKMLALGGLQIAIQFLEEPFKEEEKSHADQKEVPSAPTSASPESTPTSEKPKDKRSLFVELVNRWQTFNFDRATDGMAATLQLYIASEQGKVNLFNVYDKEKKAYKILSAQNVDMGKVLQDLGKWGGEFSKDLATLSQSQVYPLQDVTEVVALKALDEFKYKLFTQLEVEPPFVTDIFSLEERGLDINPLVLSASLKKILGFKEINLEKSEIKDRLRKLVEQTATANSWEDIWDQGLNQLYGKSWKEIPENIRKLFTTRFEPTLFSVVSYARVGSVTQRVYAIIKLETEQQKLRFIIKRIYWI